MCLWLIIVDIKCSNLLKSMRVTDNALKNTNLPASRSENLNKVNNSCVVFFRLPGPFVASIYDITFGHWLQLCKGNIICSRLPICLR